LIFLLNLKQHLQLRAAKGWYRAICLISHFLLDEAFGALDQATRDEIHTELMNMQKAEPRTIVLVTHDLNEAIRLADNIMILEKGIIQQYGPLKEVMNNPANESVKNLITKKYFD
jgi:osmoprotectant transport system ATP-binding protein